MREYTWIFRLSRRQQKRFWHSFCALGLSMTYGVLYLFASVCLATGAFHPDSPDNTHHHHDASHHQSDANPHDTSASLPDICDVALQALTTTAVHTVHLPSLVLPPGETLAPALYPVVLAESGVSPSIRAPPDALPEAV